MASGAPLSEPAPVPVAQMPERRPSGGVFVCARCSNLPSGFAGLRPREWYSAVFSRSRRVRYPSRMAHVTCPECAEEVSEPSPTCSQCDAPPAKASRARPPQSAPAQRQTHPATWVVTAAIIPLLCWDAWQTYKEARLKMSVEAKWSHAPPESGHVSRSDEQLPEYVSVAGAWMRVGEDAGVRGAQVARPPAEKPQSEAAQVAAIRQLPFLQ
jgi:hypothetical protein